MAHRYKTNKNYTYFHYLTTPEDINLNKWIMLQSIILMYNEYTKSKEILQMTFVRC